MPCSSAISHQQVYRAPAQDEELSSKAAQGRCVRVSGRIWLAAVAALRGHRRPGMPALIAAYNE